MIHRLLVSAFVLAIVLVVTLVGIRMLFPTHWRVVEAEQMLLSRWLGPSALGAGGPAENLLLCYPKSLEITSNGDLLISDRGRERRGRVVWRIDAEGTAHLFAGTGLSGDASQSLAADLKLNRPEGLAVGSGGSVFLSDGFNHSVYRIDNTGQVTRVAGTGAPGYSGDGGKAILAQLFRPGDVRLDSRGNLFIADVRNHRVRKIDTDGKITTVVGTGEPGYSQDGTLAVDARIDTPWAIEVDNQDRLLIGESSNHVVRRVDQDGTLITLAGNGVQGYSGDGGAAVAANLNFPESLFVDKQGRLFIADAWNNVVRIVDNDGVISTLLGTGEPGTAAIGAVASLAPIDDPGGVIVDARGFLVSDGDNGRVIRVTHDGIIELVAGRGEISSCSSLR